MKPDQPNGKRLLKVKPAAVYLSVSPAKVRTLIQNGELPVVPQGEHAPWLVDIKDLDAWIERRKETR
jgi:excisionase family DNA binding protein